MNDKTLQTATLSVRYLEDGPSDGQPVLLLHGFPDDATSWKQVIAALAGSGKRCIAPFIRGCGGSTFRDASKPRAGDFAALGQDALDLVDALTLNDLIVVGQDWGSPTAEIVAFARADRVRKVIKLNWYGVYSMAELAKSQAFSYPQLRTLWYVWMFNTPLGEMALKYDRRGLATALWEEWSPSWQASSRQDALASVYSSFDTDDWARVALSAYRSNISPAESDPAHEPLRRKLKDPPPLKCPVQVLTGADDGVERSPLSRDAMNRYFTGGCESRTLSGVGHFPHREAPDAVAAAIVASA